MSRYTEVKDTVFANYAKPCMPVTEAYWMATEAEFQEQIQDVYREARLKKLKDSSERARAEWAQYQRDKKAKKHEKRLGRGKKMDKMEKTEAEKPYWTRNARWIEEWNRARKGEGLEPKHNQTLPEYKEKLQLERKMRQEIADRYHQALVAKGRDPETGEVSTETKNLDGRACARDRIKKKKYKFQLKRPDIECDDAGPIAPTSTNEAGPSESRQSDHIPKFTIDPSPGEENAEEVAQRHLVPPEKDKKSHRKPNFKSRSTDDLQTPEHDPTWDESGEKYDDEDPEGKKKKDTRPALIKSISSSSWLTGGKKKTATGNDDDKTPK